MRPGDGRSGGCWLRELWQVWRVSVCDFHWSISMHLFLSFTRFYGLSSSDRRKVCITGASQLYILDASSSSMRNEHEQQSRNQSLAWAIATVFSWRCGVDVNPELNPAHFTPDAISDLLLNGCYPAMRLSITPGPLRI